MLNVPPRSAANEDSMRLGGNYGSGGSATVGKGVPRVAGRNVQTGGQDFSPWDGSPSKKTEPDETNIFFWRWTVAQQKIRARFRPVCAISRIFNYFNVKYSEIICGANSMHCNYFYSVPASLFNYFNVKYWEFRWKVVQQNIFFFIMRSIWKNNFFYQGEVLKSSMKK